MRPGAEIPNCLVEPEVRHIGLERMNSYDGSYASESSKHNTSGSGRSYIPFWRRIKRKQYSNSDKGSNEQVAIDETPRGKGRDGS